MSHEAQRFESELRSKISHKSSSFQSEEGFLIKQFKFFDIYNKGVLDFSNFYRTSEKIGVIIDKEEVAAIFPTLAGVEGDSIHYRDYAKNLFSPAPAATYTPTVQKGQTYSHTKHGVYEEDADVINRTIQRSGMNSNDYPLSTTSHLYRPTASAMRNSVMNADYVESQTLENLQTNLNQAQDSESEYAEATPCPNFNYGHEPVYYQNNVYSKESAPKSQTLYIERFKEQLILRGGRGLIGLLKQFKIFDTDSSGNLDKYEFKKAVQDYEIDVHPKDLESLFASFDRDHNDRIDYSEFISAIAGPMSKYRLQVVENAFSKLDMTGEGYINTDDMYSAYDAYRHPDVASGKSDPEGAYNEFKEAFEVYHGIVHNYDSTAKVSRDEFTDFYTFISSQIESNSQFDIMINGVWNLDNKNNYEEMPYAGAAHKVTKMDSHASWLNDHHRKMFGGSQDDVLSANKNQYKWQTTNSAKFQTGIEAPSTSAGVPTWPVGGLPSWIGAESHEDQRSEYSYDQHQ
jgi:Ca2+-binding EF-hand superfamily protein